MAPLSFVLVVAPFLFLVVALFLFFGCDVDVAQFLFGEGGCTKQLARSKPHDGDGFYVQEGLNDEMEEDEDLHNKLKSSDQANISDEQEFNGENTHFRENARVTQVT